MVVVGANVVFVRQEVIACPLSWAASSGQIGAYSHWLWQSDEMGQGYLLHMQMPVEENMRVDIGISSITRQLCLSFPQAIK